MVSANPPTFFPVFEETLYLNLGKVAAEDAMAAEATAAVVAAAEAPRARTTGATATSVVGALPPAGSDRWFLQALLQTVSENEPSIGDHDLLALAQLPVDWPRVWKYALRHRVEHLRFVRDDHRERKRRMLRVRRHGDHLHDAGAVAGDADLAQRTVHRGRQPPPPPPLLQPKQKQAQRHDLVAMFEHFKEAVEQCGRRVTQRVLGLFRQKYRRTVAKRDLARLIALHSPSKWTPKGAKSNTDKKKQKKTTRKKGETERVTETKSKNAAD